MSDNKSPIIISIILLVIGLALGYLMSGDILSANIVKALAYAVVFGLGGAILGLQIQTTKRIAETQQNTETVQADLAKEVSQAVSSTYADFSESVKSTEKTLSKLTGEVSSSLGGHTSTLDNTVNTLSSQLSDSYGSGANEIKEALTTHAGVLSGAGTAWSTEIMSAFQEHAKMIQSGVGALSNAETQWQSNLESALTAHTDRLTAATEALSENLTAISDVSKNIEKMLHIQEAIDGALNTMNKSDDFQATIKRLSKHLEDSDKLLKQAAKPRQIQLVESRVEKS